MADRLSDSTQRNYISITETPEPKKMNVFSINSFRMFSNSVMDCVTNFINIQIEINDCLTGIIEKIKPKTKRATTK